MSVFHGSPATEADLDAYRRISRQALYSVVTNRSIPLSSNLTAQTPGLNVSLKAGQAIKVIRYGSVYVAHDVASIAIFALAPLEIVVTAVAALNAGGDFSIADYSGDIFTTNSAGASPGAQAAPTPASLINQLIDDWFLYDDFHEKAPMPLNLFFQTVGWFRNTDAGAARSLDLFEYLLFEIWERSFVA